MRLTRLSIQNFRAIANLLIEDLTDAVVLAGPNGCGKSCVLDAIRLLKSAYGSYEQDEWRTWFGEFQIDLNREPRELLDLFQNPTLPLQITGTFTLSNEEHTFLSDNAVSLLEAKLWRELNPTAPANNRHAIALGATQRATNGWIEETVNKTLPEIRKALDSSTYEASLTIQPFGNPDRSPNQLLELIFSTYEPQNLGIIDYHGPNRNYNRERLGRINLTIESSEQQQRLKQHALYNYTNKYANLKTEMGSAYFRHLLARQADPTAPSDDSLTVTLKELFATFFPGKEFLGPKATTDGKLLFQVRLPNGAEHDIDDLSSGEKEVLYGYLRLHNAAPKHSILLIDEPELHLNPRLVSGLASFYYRQLGSRLDNQLWLVTHSDTLIREAVSHPSYSVFHIHPSGTTAGSQANAVKAQQELERVVIALVGDLAAYRPNAKVVIFEGGGDSAFDVQMTCTLFPEFEQRSNPIAAGNKKRVGDLYDVLSSAHAAGHLPARFYAITDSDNETREGLRRTFQWDVYHIENYLLEPRFLLGALRAVGVTSKVVFDETTVFNHLKDCAEKTIPTLVAHRLRIHVNSLVIRSVNLGFDPDRTDIAHALAEALARSKNRIEGLCNSTLASKELEALQCQYESECYTALNDGTWIKTFRGRDILKKFAGEVVSGMSYEYFRDLVITQMSENKYRPVGMANVIESILSD